ncbi:late embryogenesis abundant protein At5g17165-like [Momordica charantia]|uniref:Late embryogenesis abundant protein At5g17165-like n=1 Tax=Momordica charantia TaxID=3673 RepID=A0A6J1E0C6_MOMCH|nr:late embryogenesis abundant protein At5g17165-like [Momordica charantia]
MAAATSRFIARRLADFGKQPRRPVSPNSSLSAALSLRRGGHWSATATAYEKNTEDQEVCPTVVPDHVIFHTEAAAQNQNYWAPHPQTGVFGPPAHHTDYSPSASASKEGSVLDLKAWFRHTALEDVDKDDPLH